VLLQPTSWYGAGTVALFASGDDEQAEVYALSADGTTQLVLPDVGRDVMVSPDGRWLGYVRWRPEGQGALVVHDARSGESRTVSPETSGGLLRFAFHPDSRQVAYLDLGGFTESGVPWALVVADLENDETARYDGLMTDAETRPLPGAPVGWLGSESDAVELIIDTFLPYSEGGWMGVWGVTLPADASSAALDTLPKRELIPGAPIYTSQLFLAPDRRSVAFLGRDPDYFPDDYFPAFYDLAVNRLETAALDDGERSPLLEISDGSALGRALAWSPSGERLLFAQGFYEGESFTQLSLKSSDRDGNVVEYGPLTLPPLGGLAGLGWCSPSLALYVTWDGGDAIEHLLAFDLNTGVSVELSAAPRIEIVGCTP
jgi:hypothetical protein